MRSLAKQTGLGPKEVSALLALEPVGSDDTAGDQEGGDDSADDERADTDERDDEESDQTDGSGGGSEYGAVAGAAG
jgi:hypothetical protein